MGEVRNFNAGSITIWGVRCDIRVVVDSNASGVIKLEGPSEVMDNLDLQVQNRVLGIDGTEREPTSGNGELRVTVPSLTDLIASSMSGQLRLDTDMFPSIRGHQPTHIANDA